MPPPNGLLPRFPLIRPHFLGGGIGRVGPLDSHDLGHRSVRIYPVHVKSRGD